MADKVLQNKDKPKKGHLPTDMIDDNRYIAARTVADVWICYPWEATSISPPFLYQNPLIHIPHTRIPQADTPQ